MKKTLLSVIAAISIAGCGEKKNVLHVYSWADYMDPSVIERFEKKYDCGVCIDTFDSNESMYAKLKAGASGYDICLPSSYMVSQMIREDMLEPIDMSLLTNVIENFDHSFDSQIIDPSMKYSVPYAVTYAGFMFQKEKVNTNELSWSVIADSRFRNEISMLDDIREVIGASLMYNGFSLNSEKQNEIDIATKTLLEWKNNIRKFDAESYKTEVASKSLTIGHAYSTDSLQVILGDDEDNRRDDIGFILPKEGFTIAFDEMVIMKNSKNKKLAYEFINFIYEIESSYDNMVYNYAPIPNKNAIEKLPEDMRRYIILDKNIIKRGQILKAFSDPKTMDMYNKAWDQVKSIK